MKNPNVIKNSNNQIIALKLNRFEVVARYMVGYGANLRKLAGVANKKVVILATNESRALEIAERVHDIKETGGLSSGYVVKATKKRW
jgi:hypothetical protein